MARKLVKVRPLPRPKAPMPWKAAADIAKITFSRDTAGGLIRIGKGLYGNVFIGRIHFKDGSVQRVAIKKFKAKISGEIAEKYKQCIKDLRNAGVRIPKMSMIKLPSGELAQVSQLFGSVKKGSKMTRGILSLYTVEQKSEAVQQFTKIANAGYFIAYDVIEAFKPRGIIPIDLDSIARHGKVPVERRAYDLAETIYYYGFVEFDEEKSRKERQKLAKIALNAASPELKGELKIAIEKFKKIRMIT